VGPLVSLLVLLASASAAIVPTGLYVLVVWWLDRYEKEPLRLLAAAFVWGALPAVVLAVAVEMITGASIASLVTLSQGASEVLNADVVLSAVVAPVVEEVVKGGALLGIMVLFPSEFDGLLDGIIYGSIVGLGFAMTENLFYFVSAWSEGGLESWSVVVLGRALAFGFSHAMFTALTGIGLGLARGRRQASARWGLAAAGLGAAIVAHLLHNLFLAAGGLCIASLLADWLGLLLVGAIAALAWRQERRWIREELAEEVRLGILTPTQYEGVVARFRGGPDPWRALVRDATELALKRHQYARRGEGRGNRLAHIATLRDRIVQRRQALGDPAAIGWRVCRVCGAYAPVGPNRFCTSCGAPWDQPPAP
jgi:protease PrsW